MRVAVQPFQLDFRRVRKIETRQKLAAVGKLALEGADLFYVSGKLLEFLFPILVSGKNILQSPFVIVLYFTAFHIMIIRSLEILVYHLRINRQFTF